MTSPDKKFELLCDLHNSLLDLNIILNKYMDNKIENNFNFPDDSNKYNSHIALSTFESLINKIKNYSDNKKLTNN